LLKSLVSTYDKPASSYETLEKSEVAQIQRTVADAKVLKDKLAEQLNEISSHTIQYKILDFFVKLTGAKGAFSYWFAIVMITVIVKIVITPLTKAQFKAMKEMQKIAPLIKEIQEKYKGDQKTIGEKTMALYKEHSINPFASCLPLLVQMPILMGLYYTIRSYEFQFAKGTFLWIGSGISHLFSFHVPPSGAQVWLTARNMSEPDLILVLLYVVSMYISTKLSAVDPSQADQQKMMAIVMPVMFAFLFASFPSAFLLYWLVFNILQTAQQYLILRGPGSDAGQAVVAEPPSPQSGDSGSGRVRRRRR
jgi:YidC/Oxa1 family membrane protein insertase